MALQKIPGRAIKLGTDTAGDVAYFDGAAWQRLAIGTAGQQLTMNEAGTLPRWGNVWKFQGDYYGYNFGGNTADDSRPNVINRNSYASDTDATDVGDLISNTISSASNLRSNTHGYTAGGTTGGAPGNINSIQKFQFAASADAIDVANLINAVSSPGGHSSEIHGYMSGGSPTAGGRIDVVQKFVKSTDSDATDVGNLTASKSLVFGGSNLTHGYSAGGSIDGVSWSTPIDRFSFSTDTDSTDVGDLNTAMRAGSSSSSITHGYTAGGTYNNPPAPYHNYSDTMEKYSFAASANGTSVGSLNSPTGNEGMSGTSSTTHGYTSGGITVTYEGNLTYTNTIEKYSHTTDGNSVDVANLTVGVSNNSGTQN
jgi:hypothetical protein